MINVRTKGDDGHPLSHCAAPQPHARSRAHQSTAAEHNTTTVRHLEFMQVNAPRLLGVEHGERLGQLLLLVRRQLGALFRCVLVSTIHNSQPNRLAHLALAKRPRPARGRQHPFAFGEPVMMVVMVVGAKCRCGCGRLSKSAATERASKPPLRVAACFSASARAISRFRAAPHRPPGLGPVHMRPRLIEMAPSGRGRDRK